MKLVEKAQEWLAVERLHHAYRNTFSGPHGELVLAHLVKKFGGDTFIAGAPDVSAMQQGQRRVILSIMTFLKREPNELIEQLQKQQQEKESNE